MAIRLTVIVRSPQSECQKKHNHFSGHLRHSDLTTSKLTKVFDISRAADRTKEFEMTAAQKQIYYRKLIEAMQDKTFYCEDEDGVLRRWYPPRPLSDENESVG